MPGGALPRGPHGLSREQVADSQRTRLLSAMTALLAEHGAQGVTIAGLVERARVSRAVFYEQFADKEACLLAAYDRWAMEVLSAMSLDLPAGGDWEAFVERSLLGYLGALEADRTAAIAFLVRMEEAGPAARARRREAMRGYAAVLTERHRAVIAADPALSPLPERVLLGFVLGVRELVREELEDRPDGELTALAPDLLTWLTAMVQGARGEVR